MKKKLLLAFSLIFITSLTFAAGKSHKVVFHVDENDAKVMNLALNNLNNLASAYKKMGDSMEVELVAYGPGLNMFIADVSPVQQRIEAMLFENEDIKFSACGNTIAGRKKKTGKDVKLIDGVKVTPAGVVRIIELQEQGFAYVKP